MPGAKKQKKRARRKNRRASSGTAFTTLSPKDDAQQLQSSANARVKQDEARRFAAALSSSATTLQNVSDLVTLSDELKNALLTGKHRAQIATLIECDEGVGSCFKVNPSTKDMAFGNSDEDFLDQVQKGTVILDNHERHYPAAIASHKKAESEPDSEGFVDLVAKAHFTINR